MASVLRRLVWRGHSPRCASRSQTEPADGGAPVICAADGPQSRPHKENPAACGVTAAGGIPRSVPPPKDGGPQWPPAPRTSATRSAQACASPASTRSPIYILFGKRHSAFSRAIHAASTCAHSQSFHSPRTIYSRRPSLSANPTPSARVRESNPQDQRQPGSSNTAPHVSQKPLSKGLYRKKR